MPGAPTPPVIVLAWAANAGSAYIQNPMPVVSQIPTAPGRASYNDGFVPLNATDPNAGGIGPFIQDINGALNAVTANIVAIQGGQYPQFNATWAAANGGYALGAIVAMVNGQGLWLNTVAGNTNDPATSPAATSGWMPLISQGMASLAGQTGGGLTLPAATASYPYIIVNGNLTSNLRLVFPPWPGAKWMVINNTTGLFSVTCATNAQLGGILVPQGGSANSTSFYCDGLFLQPLFSTLSNINLIRNGNASVISNIGQTQDPQMTTPVLPGGLYTFKATLFVNASSPSGINPGARLSVGTNSGAANGIGFYAGFIGGASVRSSAQQALPISGGFGSVTASGAEYLELSGSIQMASPGQIYVSYGQYVSSAVALDILTGSSLTVKAQRG